MSSFLEKMAESAKVALDTFGLAYDAVVPSDDMLIVMNPKEKRNAQSSHGGFAGKSLIDKISDDLDEVFKEYKEKELLACADCNQLSEARKKLNERYRRECRMPYNQPDKRQKSRDDRER